jgi:hypothetical protein
MTRAPPNTEIAPTARANPPLPFTPVAGAGLRLPSGVTLTPEQIAQLQHINATQQLSKGGLGAPAAANLSSQQQAALLNALQAGGQRGVGGVQLPQAQRPGGPPGLANGAAFVGGQALRPTGGAATAQLQQANLLAQFGAQRPPLPPQQQGMARPGGGAGAALALAARPGDASGVDPIQVLQDIGRTLAQLGITVEAAVNAGLLGGLSASGARWREGPGGGGGGAPPPAGQMRSGGPDAVACPAPAKTPIGCACSPLLAAPPPAPPCALQT